MSSGTSRSAGRQAGVRTKDKAQKAAGPAKEKAQEAVGQGQDKAQEVAGQAKEKTQAAASEAKSRIAQQVDQRSSELGQRVSGAAEDLRGVAEHLRSQGKDQPARLADQAGERVEGLGGYLQRSDGERILRDVEDFGRQRPWAVVAGGLVLGFAASRFLKASSRDRYQTSRPDRYRGYPATSSAYATGGEGVATGAGGLPPMPPVEKPGL